MRLRAAGLARARSPRTEAGATSAGGVPLSSGSGWSPLGPAPFPSNASSAGFQLYGPVSGRATAVAIDPADTSGNTVLAGGANGGLWRSTNAGSLSPDPGNVRWTPLIDDQPSLAVGAIAIQPQAPGSGNAANSLLVVGTGETNSSADSYYGQGILRGIANPAKGTWAWTTITQDSSGTHSFLGIGFSQIAFSADNTNLVVAAAAGASLGEIENATNSPTADLGLYYSTDAGLHWSYANVSDGGAAAAPGSATSVVYNRAVQRFFAVLRAHGVYSSSDGINWARLTSQPGGLLLSTTACPAVPAETTCPLYRGELAVVPGRNEMYAWFVDAFNTDEGIWLSTDGGQSWPAQVSTTLIDSCGDLPGGCDTQDGSYNLALAAVPNGTGNTDLYAGAVNLYKCEITGLPAAPSACDGSETSGLGFLNLTHVYGCGPDLGAPAHVHPSQHAMDFLPVNGNAQVVMYFANDGGIYRTLDGYSRLTSGDCGSSNGFDNLNQTLGSMTQMISLAQDPNNLDTLLGGAQDNGFPATAAALSGGRWANNVNVGGGGFVQINPSPNDSDEWFTSAGGVNIRRCENGAQCSAEDFISGLVASSATLGGDAGSVDTPFMIDPAVLATHGASDLIVGTCRVWRGRTDGTGFAALSQDFDTNSTDTICRGDEINLVRTLAAGGPLDSGGGSSVIYAGTNGWGPLVTTHPSGGHVWVSDPQNAGGPWIDRTGLGTNNINPQQFPISAIVVDDTDQSVQPGMGQVAYAAIMGFGPSRIWKTTSGGAGWIDMIADLASATATLPDAPVNAIAVDPGENGLPGTLYAGTDVGVFARSTDPYTTDDPVWTEVGAAPVPNGGQSGYLPNVPVTALSLFNDGVVKVLRAATYGRGVWQYVLSVNPAFVLNVSDAEQTAFVGQTASFAAALTAVNGYNSSVALSCTQVSKGPAASCSSPASLVPGNLGTAFTVSASGPVGDYSFNLVATGPGMQAPLQRTTPLTLHVVDFNVTTPSLTNPTLNRGAPTAAIKFDVTAAGTFSGMVGLSCTGLPTGAACDFSPSSVVSPTSANAAKITLTITSTSAVPTGVFPDVVIVGMTPGGPPRTQNLSLTVTANQNYTLTVSNATLSTVAGKQATFQGMLTAQNGYNSAVNLSCGGKAPPTCTISPSSVVPTASGAKFQVAAESDSVGQYSFNIAAVGTDASATKHSAAVTFDSTFDFSFNANPSSQTVLAGGSGTYTLDLNPAGGSFPSAVTFSSCSGLPGLSNCAFSPPQVAVGSTETQVTLAISTTAPVLASNRPLSLPVSALGFVAIGVVFAGRKRRRFHSARWRTAVFLVIALAAGCGGGGNNSIGGGQPGTPTGTYNITVTATSGQSGQASFATHHIQVTLTVQ